MTVRKPDDACGTDKKSKEMKTRTRFKTTTYIIAVVMVLLILLAFFLPPILFKTYP